MSVQALLCGAQRRWGQFFGELKMSVGLADRFRWQQQLLRLKDHQGNSALHLAVIEGLPESVQLLLQAGANTDTPGDQWPADMHFLCLLGMHCTVMYACMTMSAWSRA